MAFSRDNVNFLIQRYFQESGFDATAYTFRFEAQVPRFNKNIGLSQPQKLLRILEEVLLHLDTDIVEGITESEDAEDGFELELEPITLIRSSKIHSPNVTILCGHELSTYYCEWNPVIDVLATGSSDGTARIWNMCDYKSNPDNFVLHHYSQESSTERIKEGVTSLNWNCFGTSLATGCHDGRVRIWSIDGKLKHAFEHHKGSIFALKWNKFSNYILSAGVDKTAIVSDAATGAFVQKFSFHTEHLLDVDWLTNSIFATCSVDHCIHICEMGADRPMRTFLTQNEVHIIKWDPQGQLLASSSGNESVKIWSLRQDECVQDLQGHTNNVYTINWSPTGPGTIHSNKTRILASGSCDSIIRLWNVERGVCIETLNKHTDQVFSIAFSPDGKYLASGSKDKSVHIWSTQDGQLTHSYKGPHRIYQVCWNSWGNKVGVTCSEGNVFVLDFRKF